MQAMKPSLLLVSLLLGFLTRLSITISQDSSLLKLAIFRRSTQQVLNSSLSDDLPPLNSTQSICLHVSFVAAAETISSECARVTADFELAREGSNEQKAAIEELCTAECAGKLASFFSDECQSPFIGRAIMGLCVHWNGVQCHFVLHGYNWTEVDSHCSGTYLEGHECSEECKISRMNVVETVGCCANYDHFLTQLTRDCNQDMVQECPDPFKDDTDKKKDGDEEENTFTDGNLGEKFMNQTITENFRSSKAASLLCTVSFLVWSNALMITLFLFL